MKKSSAFRTPLHRVRGLGSAHDGTRHFIWQRLTALILIPLTVWFVYSLLHMATLDDSHALAQWVADGFNAALLIALLAAGFYHAAIGMQVIIEDYFHCHCTKITALILNVVLLSGLALVSILAVLKLHFTGGVA